MTISEKRSGFALASPEEAVSAMCERVGRVLPEVERIALERTNGRVLAEPVRTDRPSPAVDVSAMDGYAVRLADLERGALSIAGDVWPGHEPPPLEAGPAVLRIFTGAPVPIGTYAVVRREDVEEHPGHIVITAEGASRVEPGANIRRMGENAPEGALVTEAGSVIDTPRAAALAAFGYSEVSVYRRLRIAIIVTGDEVLPASAAPTPWQLRDSNGPALGSLLASVAWLDPQPPRHVRDEPGELRQAILEALRDCDALCLTGGVSMGDRDHVPDVLREVGAEVLFHRLPQRPGKPVLGAFWRPGPGGPDRPIFGLPGNPVAVMVAGRRMVIPVLARLGGRVAADHPQVVAVEAEASSPSPIGLWRFLPVSLIGPGRARLVPSRGSGDIAAVAASDGFVEIPPGELPGGARPFYRWTAE